MRFSPAGAAARRSACSTQAAFRRESPAEVKGFRDDDSVPKKLLKYANRSHRFALAAAEQAFRDAGIVPRTKPRRAGAVPSVPG
jgi:3-oxoacyl-(acyl-carrier-protein) synthase